MGSSENRRKGNDMNWFLLVVTISGHIQPMAVYSSDKNCKMAAASFQHFGTWCVPIENPAMVPGLYYPGEAK